MRDFVYAPRRPRMLFGAGTPAALPQEAELHTVILPHAPACVAVAVALPDAASRARAMDSPDPPTALWRIAADPGAPTSRRPLGMRRDELPRTADFVPKNRHWNLRPLDRAAILQLLTRAHEGLPPPLLASNQDHTA